MASQGRGAFPIRSAWPKRVGRRRSTLALTGGNRLASTFSLGEQPLQDWILDVPTTGPGPAVAADTITFSDSAVANQTAVAVATDTLSLSDSAIANTRAVATATDTLSLSDSAVAAVSTVAVAQDTVTLSDSAIASLSAVAVASDTLSLSDSADAFVEGGIAAVAADTISLSDSAVANQSAVATASDTISLTDSAIADVQADIVAVAQDTITFSDSATASVQPPFSVPSIYGADAFPRKKRERRVVEDILEVIEELTPKKPVEVASAVRKVIAPARIEDYTAVLVAVATARDEIRAIVTKVVEEERQRKLRRRREEEFMLF